VTAFLPGQWISPVLVLIFVVMRVIFTFLRFKCLGDRSYGDFA